MDKRLLIIAFEEWAWRLERYWALSWGKERVQTLCLDRRLFDDEPFEDIEELNRLYEQVCCFLDEQHQPESLRGLTVLFALQVELPPEDTTRASRDVWNPLLRYDKERQRAHSRAILISWLVLTFPEVRWVFLSEQANPPCDDFCTRLHLWSWLAISSGVAGACLSPQNCPPVLFDPSGLRSRICEQSRLGSRLGNGVPRQWPLPLRLQAAVAMDEEEEYAYFNAYTAYRFGYRAWVVTTWHEAEMLLKNGDSRVVNLSLEDLYLNFVDRPEKVNNEELHLSNLEQRDKGLPALKHLERRVLVTVGHKRGASSNKRNKHYKRKLSYPVRTVYKPLAGVFDLWRRAKMWRKCEKVPRHAHGFGWLPQIQKRAQQTENDEAPRHSAPGRFLLIAERLVDRAERIMQQLGDVPEAIHATLLALEAKELLLSRTPTAAMHALQVQHEAEVVAESMFTGVQRNLVLKPRFRELEREVRAMARWFHHRTQHRSELNARLTIIERLAKRFADLHQIEEEMACLAEARKLRFDFWVRERPYRWILWPVLRYVAFSLSSLGRFAFAVAAWVFLFAVVHFFLHTTPTSDGGTFGHAVASSALFFVTLQPCQAIKHSTPVDTILAFQGCVAFLNLGLLISHLYMTVSRR